MVTTTITPNHWSSWDFTLGDSVGQPWGHVDLSSWRERGSVTVGGQAYTVARQGLAGPFVLTGPCGELARAVKSSALKHDFSLTIDERTYRLRRLSVWRRVFGLYIGETGAGSITSEGWWTRRGRANLPEGMAPYAQAFVVWLTLLMWKRDSDAVAAGTTS